MAPAIEMGVRHWSIIVMAGRVPIGIRITVWVEAGFPSPSWPAQGPAMTVESKPSPIQALILMPMGVQGVVGEFGRHLY